ncbi:MAG: Holliday junction resolvase RuvX [candidate division Zixibacteria bacterium]|nr:Holliday junction resolvase RuvX [candidate division Zixibacteria bacterium]
MRTTTCYIAAMTHDADRTFIAIDYGSRRIGLAKSDPTGLIASALTTLEVKSQGEAIRKIADIISEHKPSGLVVGYPLLPSGDMSSKCREVDRFIEELAGIFDGPIHKVDEAYSSVEAADIVHAHGKKVGQDKKRLDRLAAVIILQRFLSESTP